MTAAATQHKLRARKITRKRQPQITPKKQPLEVDAYYTIREVTDRQSPHYTVSPATLFRALRAGTLKANYVGRKVLLKGSAIKEWIEARKGGVQ